MLYSVTQTAEAIGVAPSTIRAWGNEFAEHLSDDANPPKGETRLYSQEDIAIFRTVGVLRDQKRSYEVIHKALANGDRLEPVEASQPLQNEPTAATPKKPDNENAPSATVEGFTRALTAYENRITKLEDRLQETTERLIDAETRAASLAGKLEAIEAMRQELRDKEADQERQAQPETTPRRSIWARLLRSNRISGL